MLSRWGTHDTCSPGFASSGALHLRLSLACVLREAPNAMNVLAPACGSWCMVSRGTTYRSPVNPDGRAGVDFVAEGNKTIARSGIPTNEHACMHTVC